MMGDEAIVFKRLCNKIYCLGHGHEKHAEKPFVHKEMKYEGRSSSKVSDFFSQEWEQIDTCGLV
jgi:hypothetical protein